jgi:two-component system sensor histidine kinase RstB
MLILILMALVSFLLVRPLELRLQVVDTRIEAIGRDKDLFNNVSRKKDAIGNLSTTVDLMASRIHRLLDAQNDMVRAISHELRTPVTRIRFRLTAIEDIKAEEITQHCMGIERDLTELESLIDEVLTFSKLQRDMPKLTIEPLSADTLFNMLVKSAQNINPEIEINFVTHDEKCIFADQRYFYRVLENILTNALKYTKTKVDIEFSQSKNKQIICFADDGTGVAEHLRENLFTPFYRIDDSRNKQTGGYGLGLAIVKQIIQWHGGTVSIGESEYLGAKITIELPFKPKDSCDE